MALADCYALFIIEFLSLSKALCLSRRGTDAVFHNRAIAELNSKQVSEILSEFP
jgi:hypothetical protein